MIDIHDIPHDSKKADVEQIARAVDVMFRAHPVTELRILGAHDTRFKGTVSGYFDDQHRAELVRAAAYWSGKSAGVYATLNPVTPDLLARAANRVREWAKDSSKDAEVIRRQWLLFDFDPQRPSGISSTEAELAAALVRAQEFRDFLKQKGWPDPLFANSGNGAHLLYWIDLLNDDASAHLVKAVLYAASDKFSDNVVSVDKSVHNAARISKLYGTLSCKGDSLSERPHRIARLIDVPDSMIVVPLPLLQDFGGGQHSALEKPARKKKPQPVAGEEASAPQAADVGDEPIDPEFGVEDKPIDPEFAAACGAGQFPDDASLEAFLTDNGFGIRKRKTLGDGASLFELDRCPWRPEERDGGAWIIRQPDGTVLAGCHHAKCSENGWRDFVRTIDPTATVEESKPSDENAKGKPTIAAQLVKMALDAGAEIFHSPDDVPFATVPVGGHLETHRLNSRAFRRWLVSRFRQETGRTVSRSACDEAILNLEGEAFDAKSKNVFVRVARHGDSVIVDLCDDRHRVVEITANGWRVLVDSPVKFRRAKGMLALPEPKPRGTINELFTPKTSKAGKQFRLLNIQEGEWPLVAAFLIGAFHPHGPYPLLMIGGPSGNGKSAVGEMLKALIDPSTVKLRAIARDPKDLMIAANNSWLLGYDNASRLTDDFQDELCRLSTGGGFGTRELYSDDEETLFSSQRPCLMTAIDSPITREDLLSRAIILDVPAISEAERVPSEEINDEFERARPKLLGAIFDGVSAALRNLPNTHLDELARLADFIKFTTAAERCFGSDGVVLRAFKANQRTANESLADLSPVVKAIRELLKAEKGTWSGNTHKLYGALQARSPSVLASDEWPRNARALSASLRYLKPVLAGIGIECVQGRDNTGSMVKLALIA